MEKDLIHAADMIATVFPRRLYTVAQAALLFRESGNSNIIDTMRSVQMSVVTASQAMIDSIKAVDEKYNAGYSLHG